MPLLPPERSHICIALSAVLWAQSAAGSGVGAAAAALSDAAGSALAGWLAGAAMAAAPTRWGPAMPCPPQHAATSMIATNARAGSLRWFLIACSSMSKPPQVSGVVAAGPPAFGSVARYHTGNRMHTYDFMMV